MTEGVTAAATPMVTRLFTTPVKGFTVNEPESVTLDRNGAVGDRDFFVIDDQGQLLSITKTGAFASWRAQFDPIESVLALTSLAGEVLQDMVVDEQAVVVDFWESHDVPGHIVAGPWSEWLSDIVGKPVSLVRATEPGAANDETSVTIVSEESVAELARVTGTDAIDIRRFRMLINVSGVAPYEEEAWRPKTARIGSALLEMKGPVPRCNATTRNPDSGKKDLKTLKLIAEGRGMLPNDFGEDLNMGAYAEVLEPGVISVGDRVELG